MVAPLGLEPAGGRPTRRSLLGALGTSLAAWLAGCGGRSGPTTAPEPSRVTTTGGEAVEVLVAQMDVREGDDGPRVHYRLANAGEADATVAVRTVLSVEGGGTYEATAVADVPAGEEVTIEYRVVRYEVLPPAEAENVRRGNADFAVYVNGEARSAG